MINEDGGGGQFLDFMGGHSCYEGDIELMGVPPVPPLGETLIVYTDIFHIKYHLFNTSKFNTMGKIRAWYAVVCDIGCGPAHIIYFLK